MKKIFSVLLVLLLGVVLVSCKDDKPTPPAELTDADLVASAERSLIWSGLSSEETTAVTNNLTLPSEFKVSGKTVTITWTSNKEESVKVNGKVGNVVRLDSDVEVKLTAKLVLNEASKEKEFTFTVSKSAAESAKSYANLKALYDGSADGETVKLDNLTILTTTGDGYFLVDATSMIKVYSKTGAPAGLERGQKGSVVAKFVINTYGQAQFEVDSTEFTKSGDATNEELLALAKPRTIADQIATDSKDASAFQFYKFENVKLVINTEGDAQSKYSLYITNKDTVTPAKATDLLVYYKVPSEPEFNLYKAMAEKNTTDAGVTIYALVNDFHSGETRYRMGIIEVVGAKELTNEQKVDEDIKAAKDVFAANSFYGVKGDLVLPADLPSGSTVSVSFKDAEAADNALVDLATKKVLNVPTDRLATVNFIVKVTLNGVSKNFDASINVGDLTASESITAIDQVAKGGYIKLSGKLTSEVSGNYTNYYFVEGERKVQIYGLSSDQRKTLDAAIKADKVVTILAQVDEYKSVKQLNKPYISIVVAE